MTKNTKEATTIEIQIGKLITNLRLAKGLSRRQLAEQIGVSHQQLCKYEYGFNRISAGRLYQIAKVLETPISYFYTNEEIYKSNSTQRRQVQIGRLIASIDNPKIIKVFADLLRVIEKEVK